MPGLSSSGPLKPAQILLSEVDRQISDEIVGRVASTGRRHPGRTALYRAGIQALRSLSQKDLVNFFDEVDDRVTQIQLAERFGLWCSRNADLVKSAAPELAWSWEGDQGPDRLGHFSYQGRFVLLSMMDDGRVLISGLAAVTEPIPVGERMPFAPVLFPGGTATILSMNDDGAMLASRSIVAWLLNHENDLEGIRSAVSRHASQKLR